MITLAEYQQAELDLSVRESKRGWRIHAAVYATVIAGLAILNTVLVAQTEADFFWFPFPLVGWGIGVALHYLYVVRWAGREIRTRQALIEREAEEPER